MLDISSRMVGSATVVQVSGRIDEDGYGLKRQRQGQEEPSAILWIAGERPQRERQDQKSEKSQKEIAKPGVKERILVIVLEELDCGCDAEDGRAVQAAGFGQAPGKLAMLRVDLSSRLRRLRPEPLAKQPLSGAQ